MIYMSAEGISQTVVADVHQNVEIITTNGLVDDTLCFTGTKTWNSCIYDVGVLLVFQEGKA